MRFLKCYLAKKLYGNIGVNPTAKKAAEVSGTLSCIFCGCRLLLRSGLYGEKLRFEHDQRTVPVAVLMTCAHLDPDVKAEVRHRKLRSSIGGLDVPVAVRSWFCVWCGDRYQGENATSPAVQASTASKKLTGIRMTPEASNCSRGERPPRNIRE